MVWQGFLLSDRGTFVLSSDKGVNKTKMLGEEEKDTGRRREEKEKKNKLF